MDASRSSIADQALDLADGMYELIDVAFAHDLAVAFADLGTHEAAVAVTDDLVELLGAVHDELPHVMSLGHLGALMGLLQSRVEGLYDLLLEASQLFNRRASASVLRAKRTIDLALAHLRYAARMGASQSIDLAQHAALRMAIDAVLTNLGSLATLLRALDPLELPPPPPTHPRAWVTHE